MDFFRRKPKLSFRKSEKDAFLLETPDVDERQGWKIFSSTAYAPIGRLSRYIAACGTHDLRGSPIEVLNARSWRRYILALSGLLVLWLFGFFL